MNRILEIDVERRRVRVQAGVVKDHSMPRSNLMGCSSPLSSRPPTAPPSAA
nr:hypothetical protein [Salinicola tamaricis]